MVFYPYVYYPIRFGLTSLTRHRQMIYSYIIFSVLIALAVFSQSWLGYFQQWIRFEQANMLEIPDITFGSWLFLLKTFRFILILFTVGLNGMYIWYSYLIYRMQFDGQEHESIRIRLLLGQTSQGIMVEELSFILIGQGFVTSIATAIGQWLFQKAHLDFDSFFDMPEGFVFFSNRFLLVGMRLCVGCLLMLLCGLAIRRRINQGQFDTGLSNQ